MKQRAKKAQSTPPWGTILLVLALAVLAFGGRWLMTGGDTARIGGAFHLVNGAGKEVTEKDFAGKYLLVYFGYTFCPDVCPTSLHVMAQALNALPPETLAKVAPVFVSVDPERDKPAATDSYARQFHPAIAGLTGSPEQIKEITAAYRVYYKKVEQAGSAADAYVMDHSSLTYLMGPDGRFLTHFNHDATGPSMAEGLKQFVK